MLFVDRETDCGTQKTVQEMTTHYDVMVKMLTKNHCRAAVVRGILADRRGSVEK